MGKSKGGAKKSGGAKSKGGVKIGGVKVGAGNFVGDAAPPAKKGQLRREAREALRTKSRKFHHGGAEATENTRLRMKSKVLQKQLARLGKSGSPAERCSVLQELSQVHVEAGRSRQAIEALQEVLQLQPDDPQFLARTQLLCLLMDEARGDEARQLVEGPLFQTLSVLEDVRPAKAVTAVSADVAVARRVASVCGSYSLTLLDYISVKVLQEDKNPNAAAASERRLGERLRHAHKLNPFVAEFIAFAPAFENYFQAGADLPPESCCGPGEGPLLDALKYLVGFSQISVWLDSDDEVRRFIRCTVFEDDAEDGGDDSPPFAPLPVHEGLESPLLSRWKRARSDAMDLWGEEMSVDGGEGDMVEGAEEGGEEESCEGDSIMDDDDSEDFAGREERSGFG